MRESTGKTDKAVIRFGMVEDNGKKDCFVACSGVGFDMNHAGRLFGACITSANSPAPTSCLAIVQRIFNRHEGRIWVHAEQGHGATFFFNLREPEHERHEGHLAG